LFHMAGITPEAQRLADVIAPGRSLPMQEVGEADISGFASSYAQAEKIDLVVFSAPQLSLLEMAQVAGMLEGRRANIPLFVVTSPQVKSDADRMGLTARIEAADGTVLSGMCFYQSYAREMAEANGWRRLATNSAKLTNIIGGYGYQPALMSMAACIDTACAGGRMGV
jgi:predicted aconitase